MKIQTLILSPRGSSYLHLGICLLALTLMAGESLAASQLMVTPTRVVFDSKMRNAQVTVINTGNSAGTYRISLVNKRMTLDGKIEDIKEPKENELFADKLIRYSPRQVVLEPGKSQVVRLSLRKPRGLKEGEYRSHILFKAIPEDAGTDISKAVETDKITINLTAIVSISIPVIVRHGKTSSSIAFGSVSYKATGEKDGIPKLVLELNRSGNESIYGNLLAEFVQEGGASTVIGQVSGLAVYTPNKQRVYKLPLKIPENMDLNKGVIRAYFRSTPDQGNKVLTQTQLKLP